MSQPRLRVVPCSVEKAKEYVERIHRHHTASTSARYCVAVVDETGLVRGVAMVGRPVARVLDDGWTLEVNRVATDGCENACSALYGAARRIANAMGYSRLITYIREDEPGTSMKASGWEFEEKIRARSWNMPGRPRVDKTEVVRRERWSIQATGKEPTDVIWPQVDHDQLGLLEERVTRLQTAPYPTGGKPNTRVAGPVYDPFGDAPEEVITAEATA